MNEQQIIDATHEVLRNVAKVFKLVLDIPEIRFHRKSRACGRAACNGQWVSFNLDIAEKYPTDFLSTIIHEVAHLATFKLYPNAKTAHGPAFKGVCLALNGTGKTYAEYAKIDRTELIASGKYIAYKCSCNNSIPVSRTIHNKIVNLNKKYSCKKCKTNITIAV